MNDDNPLWYDHVEPGEEPGPVLKALAATYTGAVSLACWVDRMWRALVAPDRQRPPE